MIEVKDIYSDRNDSVKSKICDAKEVGKIAAGIFLKRLLKIESSTHVESLALVRNNDSLSVIRGIQLESNHRFK